MQERMPSNIFEDTTVLGKHIKVIHCLVSIIWRYPDHWSERRNGMQNSGDQRASGHHDLWTPTSAVVQVECLEWFWFFSNNVILVNNSIFPLNHSNHCPLRDGSNPDAEVDGVKPLFGNWKAIFSRWKSSFLSSFLFMCPGEIIRTPTMLRVVSGARFLSNWNSKVVKKNSDHSDHLFRCWYYSRRHL